MKSFTVTVNPEEPIGQKQDNYFEIRSEGSYIEMFLVNYHNAIPNAVQRGENIREWPGWTVRTEWDYYNAEEILEACGIVENTNHDDNNANLLDYAFYRLMGNQALFDTDEGRQGNVYRLEGDVNRILEHMKLWITEIKSWPYWASGDDSYFDYAPDEVLLIHQILRALYHSKIGEQANDLWKDFTDWLKIDSSYADPVESDTDAYGYGTPFTLSEEVKLGYYTPGSQNPVARAEEN